jgi:hypothetical protein
MDDLGAMRLARKVHNVRKYRYMDYVRGVRDRQEAQNADKQQ